MDVKGTPWEMIGDEVKDAVTGFQGVVTGVFIEPRGTSFYTENDKAIRYVAAENVRSV